ncbi:MAG: DUF3501 family protein [Burkholderiaceae bacterium]
MPTITRESLWPLETYAKKRPEFRGKVLEHKKKRQVAVGPHVTLLFEDELTIRYQIQEMLRIEKTFEEAGIQEELDAYNPLIPNGREFKATMMIEYDDEEERKVALRQLKGIERKIWIQVEGADKVYCIADEDLVRENEEKTSAVHFVRFPLTEDMAASLKYGVSLSIGIDHEAYSATVSPVAALTRDALVQDLS